MIEEGIVYEFILLHSDAVMKVKAFLLMAIHRTRYLKKQQKAVVVQKHLRRFLVRR